MKSTFSLSILALLATLLSGCVIYDHDHPGDRFHSSEPGRADLRLFWEFRGGRTCFEANVSDILIEIDDGFSIQEFGFIDCEMGFVDIPQDFPSANFFTPGEYFVTVWGFPPRGGPNWISEGWIQLFRGSNDYTFVLDRY